jgi:sugar (pentulose or hexulose) kinase
MEDVIAIFDIGKTNKKFVLFDSDLIPIESHNFIFEETSDEDNFPCENLKEVESWISSSLSQLLRRQEIRLRAVNFSTYGASLVHLDEGNQVIGPFYNYLKPFPGEIMEDLWQSYGGRQNFELETASPFMGMLNSGFQLFWLKKMRPQQFDRISFSLHLPQYFSFRYTGKPASDYASVGCHTGLWNYRDRRYHKWVSDAGINPLLPPIVSPDEVKQVRIMGQKVFVGPGIHDSSAALLPYLHYDNDPFIVISTGTWSICMNPFNQEPLTRHELAHDCLLFLTIHGNAVKTSRLFLGKEHDEQLVRLSAHFAKPLDYFQQVNDESENSEQRSKRTTPKFSFIHLNRDQNPEVSDYSEFTTFEEAYHQLMRELIQLQAQSLSLALGQTSVSRIYVTGGFAKNRLYMKYLKDLHPHLDIMPADIPESSAFGAALLMVEKDRKKIRIDRYFNKN